MHGWMEFWAREHAEDLARQARRSQLVRALKAARVKERPSRSRRLLRGLARRATGEVRRRVLGGASR